MKNIHVMMLWVVVVALGVHGVYQSRRISAMSKMIHTDRLRVRLVELVQPSGRAVASLHAGLDGGTPEIKLKQEDSGHYCSLGFAANGTGPYLEMLSSFSMGRDPVSRIEIGAFQNDRHGIRIAGGDAEEYPPITLGWTTGRASTNANRYLCLLPGTAR